MTKTKTMMTSILSLTVISLMFTGAMQSQAYAVSLTVDAASAEWTAVDGGVSITGLGTNEVHWGIPVSEDAGDPNSGLRFDVLATPQGVTTFTSFALGELTHLNFPVLNAANGATLDLDFTISNGNSDSVMFEFDFNIEETRNAEPCPIFHQGVIPCDDRITFPNAVSAQTITIDGVEFNLALLGFGPSANSLTQEFITEEFKENTITLWAELTSDEPPEIDAPADVTVECGETGGTSNVALGDPVISDFEDEVDDLLVSNDALVFYPLGNTNVEWTVEDTDGNTASDTQTVTVEDTTDPELTVPAGFMVIANTNGGWSGDIGDAIATDVCSDVEISNDAPDVFPLGDTTVNWCATDDLGNVSCDEQTINVKPLPVDIDIKPASDPNSINVKSNGVVPVAILGSDDIDVTLVDVTSLAFGPSGATPAHDLTDASAIIKHLEDVPVIDGLTDLVSHYHQKDTGLSSGDTEACVTGTYNGGIPFEGCDAVNIK